MAAQNNNTNVMASHETSTSKVPKRLVPQLRFKEFDGEWDRLKFGNQTVSISSGKSSTKETGEYPVYGSTGVISTTNSYTHEGENILVARVGANAGLINKVSGKYGVTDNTLVIILKDSLEVSFCEYALLNFNLNRLIFGSGQPLVTGGLLKAIKLPFPSLPEQQKIAQFLTAVDTKLQQLNQKKELLAQYKKGVMQQLFSQQLRFKQEDGSDYPDWEEKKLGEFIKLKSKRNKSLGVELVLSVSNKKGFISQEEQFDGYQVASKDLSNYKIVEKNDIAYNPSRINVGSIATLKDFEIGIVSPMYVIFTLKKSLDIIYFENLIQTNYFKYLIKVGCSGSVRDSLNFDDLASFKLFFPSIEEQQKIANYLRAIDTKIETVTQQIEATQQFKKGLLQQMFV